MPNRKAEGFPRMNSHHQAEMSRRIADCRERLRRNRMTPRIDPGCAAPADGRAQGEAEAWDSPAFEAQGEETGREG